MCQKYLKIGLGVSRTLLYVKVDLRPDYHGAE